MTESVNMEYTYFYMVDPTVTAKQSWTYTRHRQAVRDCLAATARQSGTISLVVTDFLASDWSSRQTQLTTDCVMD